LILKRSSLEWNNVTTRVSTIRFLTLSLNFTPLEDHCFQK
jgi:hypothetical protein